MKEDESYEPPPNQVDEVAYQAIIDANYAAAHASATVYAGVITPYRRRSDSGFNGRGLLAYLNDAELHSHLEPIAIRHISVLIELDKEADEHNLALQPTLTASVHAESDGREITSQSTSAVVSLVDHVTEKAQPLTFNTVRRTGIYTGPPKRELAMKRKARLFDTTQTTLPRRRV